MHPRNPDTDSSSQQVLCHLLGVLEDDEQQQVEARLEEDSQFCQALVQWRRQLAPLETLRPDDEPPPGLAERTCRFVAAHKASLASRWKGMVAIPSPPSWISQTRWLDVSVVALLLAAVATVLFPAICHSRFHAGLAVCHDGLRQFGQALAEHAQQHGASFSPPARVGQFEPAGLVAAKLMHAGLLNESPRAVGAGPWPGVQEALQTGGKPTAGPRLFALPTLEFIATSPGDEQRAARRVLYVSSPMPLDASSLSAAWSDSNCDVLSSLSFAASAQLGNRLADGSDWMADCRASQGWNVLFEDDHAEFFPHSSRQELASLLFEETPFSPERVFAPSTLVDW